MKRNFVSEAAPFEQKARQEINEVKEGVERAAESVLGNDTEALRLARRELDDLTRQLENEIAQADPKLAQASGQSPNSEQNANPPAASKAGTVAKSWTPPRTPWGEPDLQGTYSNKTITPFERPASVEGREFYTREEVEALGVEAILTGKIVQRGDSPQLPPTRNPRARRLLGGVRAVHAPRAHNQGGSTWKRR